MERRLLRSNTGKFPDRMEHRQIKYRNNVIEADHGKLKRLIKPTLRFKSMKRLTSPSEDSRLCTLCARATLNSGCYLLEFEERSDLWNAPLDSDHPS